GKFLFYRKLRKTCLDPAQGINIGEGHESHFASAGLAWHLFSWRRRYNFLLGWRNYGSVVAYRSSTCRLFFHFVLFHGSPPLKMDSCMLVISRACRRTGTSG